jgi:hypothetical protein
MIQNGGDGSAYIQYYESEALAEWMEEQDDEGFAESTVGSFTFMSDGNVHINENIQTVDDLILEWTDESKESWADKDECAKKLYELTKLKEKLNV